MFSTEGRIEFYHLGLKNYFLSYPHLTTGEMRAIEGKRCACVEAGPKPVL